MLTGKQRQFLDTLDDQEYRTIFNEEQVGTALAFQIRHLREARGMTQEDLARATDKAQETISQWENPSYGRYTMSTLKQLAGAFDVALLVRFVSFGELANWTVELDQSRLSPPTYEEERQMSFYHYSGRLEWEPQPGVMTGVFVDVNDPSTVNITIQDEPHFAIGATSVYVGVASGDIVSGATSASLDVASGDDVLTLSNDMLAIRPKERVKANAVA